MAKASKDDIKRVAALFNLLEEVLECGTYTADQESEPVPVTLIDLTAMLQRQWEARPGVASAWRRVVFGCDMLIDNCCDPDSDTLEWRPEVAEFIEANDRPPE